MNIRTHPQSETVPSGHDPIQDQTLLTSSRSATQPAQQAAASASGLDHQVQNSANGLIVPFQLPQMPNPINLRVKQQDENDAEETGRSPAAKRWTVNVSLDAGAMGLVHISVGLCASAVSVRLSGDQAQAAGHLSAWLPELKAALERADFHVEELSVRDPDNGLPQNTPISL